MRQFVSILCCWGLLGCNTVSEQRSNDVLPGMVAPANVSPSESPSGTPMAMPPASAVPVASATPPAPEVLRVQAEGVFQDAVHKVSGQVRLLQNGSQKLLRLDHFATENGPDLHIYLIRNRTGSPQGDDFVNLGRLRSTQGNFNYAIPAEVDLAEIQSVSVWCKAFATNFGFASLTAVP